MNLMGCGQAVGITNTGLSGDFGAQEPKHCSPPSPTFGLEFGFSSNSLCGRVGGGFGVWVLDFGFLQTKLDVSQKSSCARRPGEGGFIIPLAHISTYISWFAGMSFGFQAQSGWTTGKTATTSLPLGGGQVVGWIFPKGSIEVFGVRFHPI